MKVYAVKTVDLYKKYPDKVSAIVERLDAQRQQKIVSLKKEDEKVRSIFAGSLLRYSYLQEKYSEIEWNKIKIRYEKYGKPYIHGNSKFNYSLSHSGEWVVCATDTDRVGIDIQEMRSYKLNIAKRFYNKEEYERLEKIENERERKECFYKMWAAKESCVKLSGRGIGAGIDRYKMSEDWTYMQEIADDGVGSLERFRIKIYNNIENYEICVCSQKEEFPESIEIVDVDVILDM